MLRDEEIMAIPVTNFGDNTDDLNVSRATAEKTALKIIERVEQIGNVRWVARILRKELGL